MNWKFVAPVLAVTLFCVPARASVSEANAQLKKSAAAYKKLGAFGVSSLDVSVHNIEFETTETGETDTAAVHPTSIKRETRALGRFSTGKNALVLRNAPKARMEDLSLPLIRLNDGQTFYEMSAPQERTTVSLLPNEEPNGSHSARRLFDVSPGLSGVSLLLQLQNLSKLFGGEKDELGEVYFRRFPDGASKISANIAQGENGTGGVGTLALWFGADNFLQKVEAHIPTGDGSLRLYSTLSKPTKITDSTLFSWSSLLATDAKK